MQNSQVISKMQQFYQTHSIITHPADLEYLYKDLPSNIDEICSIVQGLLLNYEQAEEHGISLTEKR